MEKKPATYSSRGSHFTKKGESKSEGITKEDFKTNNELNTKTSINMKNEQITVIYSWTAKEGKSEELKAIYKHVTKQMNETEPGALAVDCFFDETSGKLVVSDLFANAEAVGFHLGTTAGAHWPELVKVADPGAFLFCGDVPEEMQQAAVGMGLNATFAPQVFRFSRD